MKAAALQQAVYTQLNQASLTSLLSTQYAPLVAIFSDVPQSVDSELDSAFPYVKIGQDTLTPYNTKDSLGGEDRVQIDVFARGSSTLAGKAVADAVDVLMNRTALTISGATHITTELEQCVPTDDPDGRTTHWVMIYRVLWLTT